MQTDSSFADYGSYPRESSGSRERRFVAGRVAALLAVALLCPAASSGQTSASPQVAITGTLDVLVVDHRDRNRSETVYFIREGARGRGLELKFGRLSPGTLRTGQRVTVAGRIDAGQLSVDALSVDSSSTESTGGGSGDAALSERRTVVIMVDLQDARVSSRYTPAQVAEIMYTNPRSVDRFYRAASFGQLGLAADADGSGAPDVFGPFSIAHSAAANCNYYDWATAAESAAQSAGVNFSLYQHRVFVLPHWDGLPNCAWAGVANVGCGTFCRAWIAEPESPMVYTHELGHNFNMAHAGTDPENDGVVNSAYGDMSDPMGSSRSWHLFAAPHGDQMGWYAGYPGSVLTITGGGSFSLAAIGTNPSGSPLPQALKVAKPDSGDFYYLSYREATGWDDSLDPTYTRGVNIHRYAGSAYNRTTFVASLTDGSSFTDPANGITFAQVGHASGVATVSVVTAPPPSATCVAATPGATVSPAAGIIRPGAQVDFAYTLRNNDGADCPPTGFRLRYAGSLAATLSTDGVTIPPAASASADLQVVTSVADGHYTIAVDATDADGSDPQHLSGVIASSTITIDGTAPVAPSRVSAALVRKGGVDVTWTASSDSLSGVGFYTVFRNGVAVAQTTATRWTDGGLASGSYVYSVTATDIAGNASPATAANAITVTGRKR